MTIKPDPRYCTIGPDYGHDCSGCRYLGQCKGQPAISKHEDSSRNVDLWLCSGNDRRLFRRFASADPDDISEVGGMVIEVGDDFNPRAIAEKIAESIAAFIVRDRSSPKSELTETAWNLDELPNTRPWQEARAILRAAGCKLNPTSGSHGDPEDA